MRVKKAHEHAKDMGTPRESCNRHRGGKPPPYLSCSGSVVSKIDFRLKRLRALYVVAYSDRCSHSPIMHDLLRSVTTRSEYIQGQ